MSRIYLHTINGDDVEIGGPERAHFGCLTSDIAIAALGSLWSPEHWIRKCLPQGHYAKSGNPETLRNLLTVGDTNLTWNDQNYCVWDLILNTCMVLGSPSVKLAARIHAQCEVHLRVEGKNREWFAAMVERAWKQDRIFRDGMGWASAVRMLRSTSSDPIVMSYSVCDQFPSSGLMAFDPESEEREAWEGKSRHEQWADCMEVLRDPAGKWPELRPENFDDYGFGNGLTFMDLEERVCGTNGIALPGYEKP